MHVDGIQNPRMSWITSPGAEGVCSYMESSCSKISANLRLNFNPGFCSFYPKAFSQISFSILLRSSSHHIADKKNLTEYAS